MTRQARRNNDHDRDLNRGRVRPGVDASPFTPESLHIGARQLQVGTGWVATFAVIGYPREVGPGLARPATRLSRPGRRQRAHRTDRPRHRRRPAAHAAGQAGVRAPAQTPNTAACTTRTSRPPPRTPTTWPPGSPAAKGNCSASASTWPCTPTPNTSWPTRSPRCGRWRRAAAGCPPHHLPRPARLDHHPAARDGRHRDAPHRSTPTPWPPAFPFAEPRPPRPHHRRGSGAGRAGRWGCCTATTSGSAGLVHWDRFAPACTTTTRVILGRSGPGKSYLVKLELLRWLYRGIHARVIDPEDEYTRLAAAVGGPVIRLGATRGAAQPVRPAPAHPTPTGAAPRPATP